MTKTANPSPLRLPSVTGAYLMPVIEVECSRTVHYSKNVEVTEQQAEAFRAAFASGMRRDVQEWLSSWVDERYDVVDADEFELLNASVDDEPLYL